MSMLFKPKRKIPTITATAAAVTAKCLHLLKQLFSGVFRGLCAINFSIVIESQRCCLLVHGTSRSYHINRLDIMFLLLGSELEERTKYTS